MITSEHEDYDNIYAEWIATGQGIRVRWNAVWYQTVSDNEVISFAILSATKLARSAFGKEFNNVFEYYGPVLREQK